jgi:hypothetical protein
MPAARLARRGDEEQKGVKVSRLVPEHHVAYLFARNMPPKLNIVLSGAWDQTRQTRTAKHRKIV